MKTRDDLRFFGEQSQPPITEIRAILSLALVGNIGNITLGLAPLIVEGLIHYLALNPLRAGQAISIEMAGLCAGNLAVLWLARRVGARIVACAGLFCIAAGNLGSAATADVTALFALRFVAGLGGGLTMVVTALLSQTSRPEVAFAVFASMWIVIVSVFSAAASPLFVMGGVKALFVAVAAIALVSGLVCRSFPAAVTDQAAGSVHDGARVARSPRISRIMSCVMVAAYASAIGGVWSYVALIGSAKKLSDLFISNTLSAGFLIGGLSGSALAAIISRRLATSHLIAGCCFGLIVSVWSICHLHSAPAYALAIGFFVFFWLLSYSPIFTIQATLDPSGQLVVLGYLIQTLGFVVGPLVVATIIAPEDFGALPLASTAALLLVAATTYALRVPDPKAIIR